jgi:hypothetical protein
MASQQVDSRWLLLAGGVTPIFEKSQTSMGGPGTTSSSIVGVELGRFALRGVTLDQDTAQITNWAECFYSVDAVGSAGIIDPMIFGPRLDELLDRLGVTDRASVRVGLTIGPRHAGVGSGPSLAGWLETQSQKLGQQMTRSGELGVSFAPSRAVDAAVKLASGAGLDLVRVDLAPVAAARAIGSQVDDLVCVGSGQGWQARMRDFEVLEAMENVRVDADQPLTMYGPDRAPRSLERYGWVEIEPGLLASRPLHLGQLATAVGAAVGVLYESSGNLLDGVTVGEPPAAPAMGGSTGPKPLGGGLDQAMSQVDLGGSGAEATLRLQRAVDDATPAPQTARREVRHPPTAKPVPSPAPTAPAPAPSPSADSASTDSRPPAVPAPQVPATPVAQFPPPQAPSSQAPPPQAASPRPPSQSAGERPPQRASTWTDQYDESETDPITMFSPDTEVEEMMGKRNRRLSVDILLALIVLAVVAAAAYYVVLR